MERARLALPEHEGWAKEIIRALILVSTALLIGCRSAPHFPQNPETARLTPGGFGFLEKMPEALSTDVDNQARSTFLSFFGGKLPASFQSKDATGWFTTESKMKQIRAEARISREDFGRRLEVLRWREMPLPDEALKAMHLPTKVPRDYMTCFVGTIDRRPAAAYWSEYHGSLMLVVDL